MLKNFTHVMIASNFTGSSIAYASGSTYDLLEES